MSASPRIDFLASVRDEAEAELALAGGADIIDCKDPAAGALGALPHAMVAAVRRALPARVPVSATIGDLPCEPAILCQAARAMAATGVDYVKVGLLPGGDARAAIAALGRQDLGGARLVAVLFADHDPDFGLLDALAQAGFAGAMLDTARKGNGALVDCMSVTRLQRFVADGRSQGVMVGLAGSLRLEHVAGLKRLRPDILGFRGALCAGRARRGVLDGNAVRAVAQAVKLEARAQPAAAEALAS
jgi:uncharacterized protein (UPF0264 family)